jgi:hypothetical protein
MAFNQVADIQQAAHTRELHVSAHLKNKLRMPSELLKPLKLQKNKVLLPFKLTVSLLITQLCI